jgi:Tetracyclin repressor-like, C-terminal domain
VVGLRLGGRGAGQVQVAYKFIDAEGVSREQCGGDRDSRDFRDSVLFDEYDLAEYEGRMFDKFEDAPETLRLVLWCRAERVAGSPLEVILDSNEDKVGRIAAAQREGKVSRTHPAVALLGLARSTALVWHTQIPELASLFPTGSSRPARHGRRCDSADP